ncbi:MAG: response regulator [Acidobacteriota bacterium]
MRGNLFALLVHVRPDPCEALKPVLRRLGVDTFSVSSCREAAHLLEQTEPHLLFTDKMLPDGSWVEVLNLAEDVSAPICSILVGNSEDPDLRQTALEHGAFDCLDSPFDIESVSKVVERATSFVQAGRDRRARAAAV